MAPTGSLGGLRPDSDSLFDAAAALGRACDADPGTCGCPGVYQSDYRGPINTTRSGQACLRWDDEKLVRAIMQIDGYNISETLPEAHRESNFCRNGVNDPDGTWCYVKVYDGWFDGPSMLPLSTVWNYCNVPVCDILTPTSPTDSVISASSSGPMLTSLPSVIPPPSSTSPISEPSSSSVPTLSSSPTQECKAADKSTCGCAIARWSDYRGTLNKTIDGVTCERWDTNPVGIKFIQDYPDAGLDENFCRNPGDAMITYCIPSFEEYGIGDLLECDVPMCDPCSCMPPCGQPNQEKCGCPSALQAEACCKEGDAQCKCLYLKDACHTSLQNNSTDFCFEAQAECCEVDDATCKCGYWKEACDAGMKHFDNADEDINFPLSSMLPCYMATNECCTDNANPTCECAVYDQICAESQYESSCEYAAPKCCSFVDQLEKGYMADMSVFQCYCDFFNYNENVYGFKSVDKSLWCAKAAMSEYQPIEKSQLEAFYHQTGGDYWYDNTGWLDEKTPHCQWFGLTCNDDGLLVEIDLKRNNLTGTDALYLKLFNDFTSSGLVWTQLRKVKVLDLSDNNLSGNVDAYYIRDLLSLEHIDISNNLFDGYAEMQFPPSTMYANFSHNNFIGVSFKRFNPAYETLKVVDLGNNKFSQDAAEVFLNIPPNLDDLILSNNAIVGNLPNPFPCKNIRRFAIANNFLSGSLPDFPGSTPRLQELDLSNQKQLEGGGLTGAIPIDMFKLSDLTTLDLARNSLTGPIPSSIGNLVKLEVLNLSSNALDQMIPSELGRLGMCSLNMLQFNFYVWILNLPVTNARIGVLEILDLSHNKLDGRIPSDIGDLLGTLVYLQNNSDM